MIRFQTRNSSLLVIRSAVKVLLNSCRLKILKNRNWMNALKKDKYTSLGSKKKSAYEASRARDWERVKGVTRPSPDLSSVRFARREFWLSQIFFAALFPYFPHCGAWSQVIRPRTQTEYRKSKGGKDRQN